MFLLGLIYQYGRGVARDHSEAARYFRMAVEQGNSQAKVRLLRIVGGGGSAPCRLHFLHLHPVEAEADGASLPARAQAEVATAPRRHLPVDQAGGKESRVDVHSIIAMYFCALMRALKV
jgi:TPR repeat protein